MKRKIALIHKLLKGENKFYNFFVFLLIPFIFSCSSTKQYHDYNYFSGSKFYNDTLNISAKLFGDMNFSDPQRKTFRSFKSVDGLMYRNLLFTATTFVEPFYDLLFFYDNEDLGQYTHDTEPLTKLIFHDSTNQNVLFKKTFNGKSISIYLIPRNGKSSVLEDGNQLIDAVKFDVSAKDDLNYSDVFNSYMDESNILYVVHKLNTAPIPSSKQSEWAKFQFLATILSNDTDYPIYLEIIEKFEENRKKHLKPIISEILQKNPETEITLKGTIEEIKSISKNENVIMLNEMHWLPNHRIFATQLLNPLKENGFKYLAVEAVTQDFVADLNNRTFPTKNTGYYTREPFFGLFIRKAIEMGFKIVAYDEFEVENRERAQAENLNKIFTEDPDAKVFVYAGIDHILENNADNKRMAQYFKEITGINPITIDQVELVGNEEIEVLFFPSSLVPKNKNINSDVDYFLINNLKPSLNMIFDKNELSNYTIELSDIKNIQKQELYVSVFISNEYKKYKSQAVPVFNKIFQVESKEISLLLPIENFQVKIWNVNNELLFSHQIEVTKTME